MFNLIFLDFISHTSLLSEIHLLRGFCMLFVTIYNDAADVNYRHQPNNERIETEVKKRQWEVIGFLYTQFIRFIRLF